MQLVCDNQKNECSVNKYKHYQGSTMTRSISSIPRFFIASTKPACSFTVASHSAYSTASFTTAQINRISFRTTY